MQYKKLVQKSIQILEILKKINSRKHKKKSTTKNEKTQKLENQRIHTTLKQKKARKIVESAAFRYVKPKKK